MQRIHVASPDLHLAIGDGVNQTVAIEVAPPDDRAALTVGLIEQLVNCRGRLRDTTSFARYAGRRKPLVDDELAEGLPFGAHEHSKECGVWRLRSGPLETLEIDIDGALRFRERH